MRRNGKLIGYLIVLALVLATLWGIRRLTPSAPAGSATQDMPGLGQVPTEQQIHGSGPPPVHPTPAGKGNR
jgi:hypothetical protein